MLSPRDYLPLHDSEVKDFGFSPLIGIKPDYIINTKKLGYVLKPESFIQKVIALQAGTGQGKTTLALKIAAYLREINPAARILVITRNCRAAIALAKLFNGLCYLDARENPSLFDQASIIIITPNSLTKLLRKGELPAFDFLFVDESQSVHGAFGDKTFTKGLALKAYRVYETLIRLTETILFADATLDYLTLALPKELGRKVTHVVNQYSANKRRAFRYQNLEIALITWRRVIAKFSGSCPVVSAWTSKKRARAEAEILSKLYGADKILLVTANTLHEARVQRFLASPTLEALLYRAILYSPVMGNSLDIQTPIGYMFVFQTELNVDAQVIVQMAGRFRQAKELHIYQPKTKPTNFTEWSTYAKRRQAQALYTEADNQITISGSGLNQVISLNKEAVCLSNLTAFADANSQHSKNKLQAHTNSLLSPQWEMTEIDTFTSSQVISGEIREQVKVHDAQFIEKMTIVPSVDEETFQTLQRSAAMTEDIEAGYHRFKVENLLGQEISLEYATAYATGELDKAVNYLEYHSTRTEELHNRDSYEIFKEFALNERHHYSQCHELLRGFIQQTFGRYDFDSVEEYDGEELKKAVTAFMEAHGSQFTTVMNLRSDNSKEPMAVLRRILDYLGLRLERGRRERKSSTTFYHIDDAALRRTERFVLLINEARYRKEYAEAPSEKLIQFS